MHEERGAWLVEAGDVRHEHVALAELLHLEHVAPVADVRDGDTEQPAELEDLRRGVLVEPRLDHRLRERAVLAAPAHRVQALVCRQVRPADHAGEVVPLLRREQAQADPPVLAANDLRPVAAARHHRDRPGEVPVEHRVVQEADRHHLERRHLHVGAFPGPGPPRVAGERGERRHRAGRPLTVPDAHLERWRRRGAAARHEPAPRLQHELVRRCTGERAVGPEGRDRDHACLAAARPKRARDVDEGRSAVVHHDDVGVRHRARRRPRPRTARPRTRGGTRRARPFR